MEIDGSLDPYITCQYCKHTSHELENCKWLQCKLGGEHMAAQGVVTEESLNPRDH